MFFYTAFVLWMLRWWSPSLFVFYCLSWSFAEYVCRWQWCSQRLRLSYHDTFTTPFSFLPLFIVAAHAVLSPCTPPLHRHLTKRRVRDCVTFSSPSSLHRGEGEGEGLKKSPRCGQQYTTCFFAQLFLLRPSSFFKCMEVVTLWATQRQLLVTRSKHPFM
jgi:hypothetical protein